LAIFVTKADGTKELFDREKVVRTCLRMGATGQVAETIAEKIEMNLYDGVETRKILQMIFRQLSRHEPAVKHLIDLRKALSLMKSKPDLSNFPFSLLWFFFYTLFDFGLQLARALEHLLLFVYLLFSSPSKPVKKTHEMSPLQLLNHLYVFPELLSTALILLNMNFA